MASKSVLALVAAGSLLSSGVRETVASLVPRLLCRNDAPVAADVVVVFGGGSGERIRHAARLVEAGYATRILYLGTAAEKACARTDLASWKPERACEVVLAGEDLPDTATSVRYANQFMARRGYRSALVVSHSWHLGRINLLWWGLSSSAAGVTVTCCPPDGSASTQRTLALELLKLASVPLRWIA